MNFFMASRIDTLISKCRSWDEFVELVNALPKTKNKEKGDLFERLTQVYLQTQPTYRSKLKNVYLLSDKTIPEQLRTKLNLPDNDEGIDLVCETYSGEYWSVQCKYKSDQSAALMYKELSTFNSLSFNACKGISLGLVAHTSTKPVKKSHLMPMVNEIGLEKWLEISDADWKQIISVCRSNRLKPPKKRSPRRHQKAAIADAHNHFVTKKQKRGKLIMPCGTGKSLTAYWIAQALEAKTIVVAVPSLALVRQSLADWTAEYLAEGVIPEWLAVCSDHSVGALGDADSTVATAYEMGIPTSPSDEELDNFLKKRSKAPKIVFTTYQSAEKLCDASRRNNKAFDLLIADEAHKTVGRKSKSFATLLFDENIKVKRRLFMTATERVFNASRDDVVSMDDPDIYGSTCHQLSFKEAIKQKIICDYKIVTIAVSDAEISELIKEKAELAVSAGNKTIETDAHSLAAGIAMQKAFKKYGIKHAITFHSSIKRAESFKDQQEDLPNNAHISHSHISSKLSAGQRAKLLKGFAEEERSLVTNARCLTEGVDIKAIDCVAFVDPKQSTVDIVQAAGRAMRQSKETGKDIGYIVVPLLIENGKTLDEISAGEKYKSVLRVITSLSTQDERIVEELKQVSAPLPPSGSKIIEFDDEITSLLGANYPDLKNLLQLMIWQRVGKANWLPFDEARSYVHSLKLTGLKDWGHYKKTGDLPPNIPRHPEVTYSSQNWKGYGDWLGTFAIHGKDKKFWPFEKARQYVRNLGFTGYKDWRAYAESPERNPNIPFNPDKTYATNGWAGTKDWIGTGSKVEYKSFKEARAFARSLKLTSISEWEAYTKSDDFPPDLPLAPQNKYKDEGWYGFVDWLGTEKFKLLPHETYWPFEKAKKYVHSLKLKNTNEWRLYSKAPEKPKYLPANPDSVYRDKGWQDISDWLGVSYSRNSKFIEFRDFKSAKKFVHSLKLQNRADWHSYVKGPHFDSSLPMAPENKYRHSGWKGWGDFLGTDNIRRSNKEMKHFHDAREFARSLKLSSASEWRKFWKSSQKPGDIPFNPDRAYQNLGWNGWGDWLGTFAKASNEFEWRSFKKARTFARTKRFKNVKDWNAFASSNKRPDDIPYSPDAVYRDKGWSGWADFLGNAKKR
ncbi:DEAD/DEAH box helicase family protein [Alphaproteobacteria bacterium]|nr:DEAD/DEAH box helicase family protein [Alphaproteobacteria bacterium]